MAYTGVDEFGDLKREKSEEEVVKMYNERVHKVILAWKNLHGLFENIQNDNAIRPIIDHGKPVTSTGPSDLSESDLEREKRPEEKIKKAATQVMKEISDRKDKEIDNAKSNLEASPLGAGEEVTESPAASPAGSPQVKKEKTMEKETGSVVDERKQSLSKVNFKELAEVELDRDKNEGEVLKKTGQVMKEMSDRKVKERAAAKVKLIGALASELGDEVRMLKDQLHQTKLEKKQLEEKNLQKEKHIRSLVDERKQLMSKISKLSEELNALSIAHHFRTAEVHHRPGSQGSTSRAPNRNTTPTKQSH